MKQIWKLAGSLMLAGILLLGSGIAVFAEEVVPAGYHVYEVEDDYVSDTWYATARGAYLNSATSSLEDTGGALCIGSTTANQTCRVFVGVYLYGSSSSSGPWSYVNKWTNTVSSGTMATVSSGNYSVTRGKYYYVYGSHTAGTNSTTTTTSALYFK